MVFLDKFKKVLRRFSRSAEECVAGVGGTKVYCLYYEVGVKYKTLIFKNICFEIVCNSTPWRFVPPTPASAL